ncbi:DNA repair protein RadA [Nocardioides marmorisolisilvae]|uniref:DNA repair protein RadA n=1 Tax=Nocardioides marmorisolisilvae TaxID=1542737 RepID=A0A3N0E044_9ACTN|nr:DNA repair protein RadA [Nocardioides marmorisolisilvae]RNL81215.1 DNA repair protein RadA [Nocardioides marmorisolisilvae]
MAAKAKTAPSPYQCSECGWETAKWVGRCGECQAWGTLVERSAPKSRVQAGPVTQKAMPIGEIPIEESQARGSGVPELDRVLGGGLVPGAAILLAGEPGVGKSTLLLEVAAQTARNKHRTLYLTGEESAAQVRLRADRTGGIQDELYLAAETDLGAVLGHVEDVKPTLLVIDSIQTISASDVDGVPGGVTQVKEVAAALIRMAKLRNITLVLVGHVTKDGSIAGPRVLEHLVDVVLHFEGERSSRLRMVRAMKNRFGPVDEVGCFDLSASGIVAITDPTGLFLDTRHGPVPGTCVAVAMEGRRPLLSEVQALVTLSASERPRRTTSGVDSARVAMILAILQQHAGIRLHSHDVFVSSVGGARLTEPSNDLAIALAIVSAHHGQSLGRQVVAVGELGLSGELRRVRDLDIRLAEAGRMGFRSAAVPAEASSTVGQSRLMDGLRVVDVDTIATALRMLGMTGQESSVAGG